MDMADREDDPKEQKENDQSTKPETEAWNRFFPHAPQKKITSTDRLISEI